MKNKLLLFLSITLLTATQLVTAMGLASDVVHGAGDIVHETAHAIAPYHDHHRYHHGVIGYQVTPVTETGYGYYREPVIVTEQATGVTGYQAPTVTRAPLITDGMGYQTPEYTGTITGVGYQVDYSAQPASLITGTTGSAQTYTNAQPASLITGTTGNAPTYTNDKPAAIITGTTASDVPTYSNSGVIRSQVDYSAQPTTDYQETPIATTNYGYGREVMTGRQAPVRTTSGATGYQVRNSLGATGYQAPVSTKGATGYQVRERSGKVSPLNSQVDYVDTSVVAEQPAIGYQAPMVTEHDGVGTIGYQTDESRGYGVHSTASYATKDSVASMRERPYNESLLRGSLIKTQVDAQQTSMKKHMRNKTDTKKQPLKKNKMAPVAEKNRLKQYTTGTSRAKSASHIATHINTNDEIVFNRAHSRAYNERMKNYKAKPVNEVRPHVSGRVTGRPHVRERIRERIDARRARRHGVNVVNTQVNYQAVVPSTTGYQASDSSYTTGLQGYQVNDTYKDIVGYQAPLVDENTNMGGTGYQAPFDYTGQVEPRHVPGTFNSPTTLQTQVDGMASSSAVAAQAAAKQKVEAPVPDKERELTPQEKYRNEQYLKRARKAEQEYKAYKQSRWGGSTKKLGYTHVDYDSEISFQAPTHWFDDSVASSTSLNKVNASGVTSTTRTDASRPLTSYEMDELVVRPRTLAPDYTTQIEELDIEELP